MAVLNDTQINGNLNLTGTLTTNMGGGQHPLLDLIYPVGSVIMTMDNMFTPSTYWGGTWVKWTDGYLKVDDTPNSSANGGYKITKDMLPSHNHTFTGTQETISTGKNTESWVTFPTDIGTNSNARSDYELVRRSNQTSHYSSTTIGDHIHSITITPKGSVEDTGSGNEYKPKYYAVIAWQRTK